MAVQLVKYCGLGRLDVLSFLNGYFCSEVFMRLLRAAARCFEVGGCVCEIFAWNEGLIEFNATNFLSIRSYRNF